MKVNRQNHLSDIRQILKEDELSNTKSKNVAIIIMIRV